MLNSGLCNLRFLLIGLISRIMEESIYVILALSREWGHPLTLTDKRADHMEKWLLVIFYMLLFSIIGAIARFFIGPVSILPVSELVSDIAPMAAIFSVVGGAFAYFFPRAASIVSMVLPIPGDYD